MTIYDLNDMDLFYLLTDSLDADSKRYGERNKEMR